MDMNLYVLDGYYDSRDKSCGDFESADQLKTEKMEEAFIDE